MDAAYQIIRKIPPTLAASRMFRGFNLETERPVRARQVESNQVLEDMKGLWARFSIDNRVLTDENAYAETHEEVRKLGHSADDVEEFSIALAEFQGEPDFSAKAGAFLSILINDCREDKFVIHTAHITKQIHHIGTRNTKDIIVEGDAGYAVGYCMKSGSIAVKGDADHSVGCGMKSGTITVRGNAGTNVGIRMEGGTIIVEGNADGNIGVWMKDGSIIVRGYGGNGASKDCSGGSIIVECWLGNR